MAASPPPETPHSRRATVAAIALFAAVALYNNTLTTKDYESVYCNRAGTTDAQWVALAGKTLTRAMI